MEASGGYERSPFLQLWEAGLACAIANPRQVRCYAEAMGVLEKTDRIDARMIACFAITRNLRPTPLPSGVTAPETTPNASAASPTPAPGQPKIQLIQPPCVQPSPVVSPTLHASPTP